jgi:hypothetical protein
MPNPTRIATYITDPVRLDPHKKLDGGCRRPYDDHMNNTITLDRTSLTTMSRDEIFAAFGRSDLTCEAISPDAATKAARRTVRTPSAETAPETVTDACVVLISADNNPL